MMRKIISIVLISAISIGAIAQSNRTAGARTTFGITGGVNWSNINGKDVTGAALDNKLKTGFNAGVNAQIPLSNGFYVQPGVEYRQKGSELSNGNKLTLGYIDIPVNFIYKPALGTGTVVLGFGPYLGLGVHGKVKASNGTERKVQFDNTYSASEAADLQFKRMDAGANFMAGYEFANKFSAMFNTQLGFMNINPETDIPNDKTRYRNTNFGLSLGYRLN
jgi:hypothetical protein